MTGLSTQIKILVTEDSFDLYNEYSALHNNNCSIGAIIAFAGHVRDFNLSANVNTLELEYYPEMDELALSAIANKASQRWNLNAVRIIHRIGKPPPSDQIMLVLSANAHRDAAFENCQFIMDHLKTEAPFWKKELTLEGGRWLDARVSDNNATAR